jgi:hypothetical protein
MGTIPGWRKRWASDIPIESEPDHVLHFVPVLDKAAMVITNACITMVVPNWSGRSIGAPSIADFELVLHNEQKLEHGMKLAKKTHSSR